MGALICAQQNAHGYGNINSKIRRKNSGTNLIGLIAGFDLSKDFFAQRQANLKPQQAKRSPNSTMKHIGSAIKIKRLINIAPGHHAPKGLHCPTGKILNAAANAGGDKKEQPSGFVCKRL